MLSGNWNGQERLRLVVKNQYPKYGNNQPEADTLMTDLVAYVASRCV